MKILIFFFFFLKHKRLKWKAEIIKKNKLSNDIKKISQRWNFKSGILALEKVDLK
jgi:hypothetical protein